MKKDSIPTLDLHGFKKDEVATAVDRFLVLHLKKKTERIRIITGKGTGVVKTEALNWLKMGGYPFKAENEGSYLVFIGD